MLSYFYFYVCLSSESCARVLNKRGISVHFCIDNDGTIYQLLDTQHRAWHAGDRSVNDSSIGVEISNAYYLKYQSWYKANGFGERPVVTDAKVHGRTLEPHLGFYPVQIQALQALMEAVSIANDIPLQTPLNPDGTFSTVYERRVADSLFQGFVSHYHITERKIDCAGLDINQIIQKIK